MGTISKYPILSREDEDKYATQYKKKKSPELADKLIKANLRFVAKVVYKYSTTGHEMMDLIQEGNQGLLIALDKFEPARGYRFITYAVWWIKAYVRKYVMENHSQLKIGTTAAQRNLFFSLRSKKSALESKIGNVTVEDLSELLGEDIKDIESMELRLAQKEASLQIPLGYHNGDGDETLQDTIEDHSADQFSVIEKKERISQIKAILDKIEMNPKEKRILEVRLTSDSPTTLREIGAEFGISRERIRQIESKLLQRVREAIEREPLHEDMRSEFISSRKELAEE